MFVYFEISSETPWLVPHFLCLVKAPLSSVLYALPFRALCFLLCSLLIVVIAILFIVDIFSICICFSLYTHQYEVHRSYHEFVSIELRYLSIGTRPR
jgi:hypothetical protein